jgi:glycine/D-amino acid oxidase-like deaminating enzyme/nitrite reductase/ring-hydroxylating ferredoxin subunit
MKDAVLWTEEDDGTHAFPPLRKDTEVDVAIVGGGIVGLAAAQSLFGSHRVAVFEGARIGHQATGRSTAKVTSQHGPIYRRLVGDLGEDEARAYAQANQDAVAWIVERAEGKAERVNAYVYADTPAAADHLREEAEVARRLGLPADFAEDMSIGVKNHGVLRFSEQAQINPCTFLRDLATNLERHSVVHEDTRILEIEHGMPCILRTRTHTIRAHWVIVATQLPVVGDGNFFAKAYPHAHPVIAARIGDANIPEGMFISAGEPTRSFRRARVAGVDYVVVTGEEYRPGERDGQAQAFAALDRFLADTFAIPTSDYRWTNEDFKPMDGLPFVGAATEGTPRLLVATGFDAWGISTGVVAAQILAHIIRAESKPGDEHPLAAAFDARRRRPLKSAPTFILENAQAGFQMFKDRGLRAKVQPLSEIAPGDAGIIKHNGQQVAVSRDSTGNFTAVSAICTHLGCVLGWNGVDRTWDCPCHGSRFSATGAVLSGPAVTPLAPVTLPDSAGSDDTAAGE